MKIKEVHISKDYLYILDEKLQLWKLVWSGYGEESYRWFKVRMPWEIGDDWSDKNDEED